MKEYELTKRIEALEQAIDHTLAAWNARPTLAGDDFRIAMRKLREARLYGADPRRRAQADVSDDDDGRGAAKTS